MRSGEKRAPLGHRGDYPGLTGVRFLAALSVAVCHFHHYGVVNATDDVFRFLDGGRTAVTLFFVLSGFILAVNYPALKTRAAVCDFWVNRFARIYPTVLLSLLIGGFGVAWALHDPSGRLLEHFYSLTDQPRRWLSLSLAAQLALVTGWIPAARINQPWNHPTWSISNEMFFYLLFPVLIGLFARLRSRLVLIVLTLGWIGQGLVLIALSAVPHPQIEFVIAQFPLVHLVEFVVGVGVGTLWMRGILFGTRTVPPWTRAALVGGSCVALGLLSWWRPVEPAYYLLTPWFAALVIGLAMRPSGPGLLGSPLLRRLGEGSYALYLLHMPLAYIYLALWPWQSPWAGWLFLVVVIVVADLVFAYAETPSRRWIRGRWRTRPAAVATT